MTTTAEAVALAVRRLEERGFTVTGRNERGDSVYLASPDGVGVLRVSNHARTPAQRRKHPEVATSIVIREPKSAAQVEALVAAAIRQILAKQSS